jgi:hypothetical protein
MSSGLSSMVGDLGGCGQRSSFVARSVLVATGRRRARQRLRYPADERPLARVLSQRLSAHVRADLSTGWRQLGFDRGRPRLNCRHSSTANGTPSVRIDLGVEPLSTLGSRLTVQSARGCTGPRIWPVPRGLRRLAGSLNSGLAFRLTPIAASEERTGRSFCRVLPLRPQRGSVRQV